MIRVALLSNGSVVQGGEELIDRWNSERGDRIWIDITEPTQETIEPLLEGRFHFHELAAEDSLSPHTLPKFDPFDTYDFFIFRSIEIQEDHFDVETRKLSSFLSDRFFFTIHRRPLAAIDNVWSRLPQDKRLIANGLDFVLYSILDILVDLHFPLIENVEAKVDDLQDRILGATALTGLLEELLHLKRMLNVLRRQSFPQRELFNSLSRGEAKFIRPEHLIYFRDLYDHMFRISESIDNERDLIAGTMEAYLSVVANRTNDIMKVLTIFSSILLPINLIAGIYGMNFQNMPELRWHYGYLWAFSLMVLVATITLGWFAHMGWIFVGNGWRDRFFNRHRHHHPHDDNE